MSYRTKYIQSLALVVFLMIGNKSYSAPLMEASSVSGSAKSAPSKKPKNKSTLKRLDQKIKRASGELLKSLHQELKNENLPFVTLAVLPFKSLDKGAEKADVDAALTELFSTHLSSQDKIIAVERGRINSVITELNRVSTGEVSAQGAAQAGKLLGARYVLIGSITTMGSALQATTRLVTSETGEVISGEVIRAPQREFVKFQQDVVVPKSKMGAAIRSFLVPGWGQLYNGAKVSGYTTIIASTSAVGVAAFYGYLGTMAEAEYKENRLETVSRRADANRYYRNARVALWSYAAIWSIAVLNAYASGTSDPKIDLKGWADLESGGLVFSGDF